SAPRAGSALMLGMARNRLSSASASAFGAEALASFIKYMLQELRALDQGPERGFAMLSWFSRKHVVLMCAGVAIAVAAGAAGAATRSSSAGDIPKLTWALGASVRGLEYTHSADSGSATVISVGCETLVRFDKNGGLQPALADSFSTPNATTYVYHVRKGVKF